jgi:hypothetical protein
MKLRDFPGLLDAWPGQPHESDSQGSPTLDDAAESLIDCFLQPRKETTCAVIVILTACRGEECSRNLRVREESFAEWLCDFLWARIGRPIREIGDLAVDFR